MTTTINNLSSEETRLILEWVNEPKNAAVCKSWRAATEQRIAMLMNSDQGYFHSKILRPFLPSSAPPSTHPEQMRFMAEVIKNVREYCELTPNTAPPILSAHKPIETAALEEIVTRVSTERSEQDLIIFMDIVNGALPSDQQFRPSSPGLTSAQIADEIRLFFQSPHPAIQSVTTLNLDFADLFSIPPEIGHFINLQELYVSCNYLTSLPPEIGHLGNLKNLYVSNNHIISLPPEIGHLGNLQGLFVETNHLSSLPPEIGHLGNLTGLGASCNRLTSLPPEIGQLGNLQTLFVNYNNLTALPLEIIQLNHLSRLELQRNPAIANTRTWYNRILSVLYQSPTDVIIKTFRQAHPNCTILL